MKHRIILLGIVAVVVLVLPMMTYAQDRSSPTPHITGTYSTTYYASFDDWNIFPVLVPLTNLDSRLHYTLRYDLRQAGQIFGEVSGSTAAGSYEIDLPAEPMESAWLDTDNNPSTPSNVKVFIAGIGNGMIQESYISRYDFMYTTSFRFDPNSQTWGGRLLVWAAEADAAFPLLNGDDNIYYTADDVAVTVPAGWSIIEVDPQTEAIQVFQESNPSITLIEPPQLGDVDLTHLSYADAFYELIDNLERTYVFTEYRNVDWNTIRETYGPQAAKVQDDYQYQTLLEAALFSFQDGHLTIVGPGIVDWYWGAVGMQVYPVKNQLMVVETTHPGPMDRAAEIIPGTMITAINGEDALSYYNRVPHVIFSGGHDAQQNWYRGDLLFRGVPGTVFEIDYRLPDGTTGHASLTTVQLREIGDSQGGSRYPVSYRILDNNVGYIEILNFTSGRVDDLWDAALDTMISANVNSIIIDLRNNGGGFSLMANYMLGDFLAKDLYAGMEVSSLDEDGDGTTDIREEYYYGREQRFDPQNLMVLVGPNCYSACEFAAQGFKDIGATIIGHLPTGGAGGGVGATYYLPGGTQVYGMAVVMSLDPDENVMIEGRGVELDVVVPFTVDGLASGQDLVLQAAQQMVSSRVEAGNN